MKAILDYRTAQAAIDAFNDKESGMAMLNRNPQLVVMLQEMERAQTAELGGPTVE